ncbi:hypothetical protein D3C81_1782320 [compost metagenome]
MAVIPHVARTAMHRVAAVAASHRSRVASAVPATASSVVMHTRVVVSVVAVVVDVARAVPARNCCWWLEVNKKADALRQPFWFWGLWLWLWVWLWL